MINLIFAMDTYFLIGNDNKLPWRIPHDLKYFRDTTKDKIVVMGRLTYQSMKQSFKNGKLPWQKMYVISRDVNLVLPDAVVINDLERFLKEAKEELFIIGGSQIYKIALPYADVLYITHVLGSYNGDAYFPKINLSNYKVVWKEYQEKVIFTKYMRR